MGENFLPKTSTRKNLAPATGSEVELLEGRQEYAAEGALPSHLQLRLNGEVISDTTWKWE